MAEESTEIDFDKMSDDDFRKLDEEQFSGNVPEGETTLSNNGDEDVSIQVSNEDKEPAPENSNNTDSSADVSESDESDIDPDSGSADENQEETSNSDPMADEGEPASEEDETPDSEQADANAEQEEETVSEEKPEEVTSKTDKGETPAKAGYYKLPDGMDTSQVDEAIGFFKKITVPFKADGKDFSIRSPEDAIRLIQQGVNYSRRMQEIKPMKQLNRMLQDQELNDPDKLNFLIDLSKGDKGAITQLLKSHGIDPMDLDTEKDSGYQANNYQGDSQDNAFRDALDTALTSPDGQALVRHIHNDWDAKSKARIREDPNIIGTLQEFKASGVYDKVVEELEYQQSLGYMQNTPFLQAFDQVGEAMKNAGVFDIAQDPATSGSSMAPVRNQPQNRPVATGGRKPQGQKKPAANPHLSSTPPSKQPASTSVEEIDFDKMSDEDFAKLAPPE